MLMSLKPMVYLFFIYNLVDMLLYLISPVNAKLKNYFTDLIILAIVVFLVIQSEKQGVTFLLSSILCLTQSLRILGFILYEKEKMFKSKASFVFCITMLASLIFILIFLFTN